MESLNIILIDDSKDFADQAKRWLESQKHHVKVAHEKRAAIGLFETQPSTDVILIDCILPDQDGLELAQEIKRMIADFGTETKVFMISGILQEAMIKDAIQKKQCEGFIAKKNFNEDLMNSLQMHFDLEEQNSQNLDFWNLNSDEFIQHLNNMKNPFDSHESLFYIFQLSNYEFNGEVSFLDQEETQYQLHFYKGSISSIRSSDFGNSMGETLVALGYLKENQLSEYVSSPEFKESKLPIGLALQKKNLVSPHAIDLALKNQAKNRLASLFSSKKLSLSKIIQKQEQTGFLCLGGSELANEIALQSHSLDALQALPFIKKIFGGKSFSTLFSSDEEKTKYAALTAKISSPISDLTEKEALDLFSLFLSGKLEQKEAQIKIDKDLLQEMNSLEAKLEKGSPYYVLGISQEEATDQKVAKRYHALAKDFHPDKVTSLLKGDDLERAQRLFTRLTEVFNQIKTEESRKSYESFNKNKKSQSKILNSQTLEQAKKLLLSGMYKKAFDKLNTAEMKKHKPLDFGLYFLWGAIKSDYPEWKRYKDSYLEDVSTTQDTVLKNFVLALISHRENNMESYQKYLSLTLKENPGFLPARREIKALQNNKKSNKTSFTSWFSFKKSS